MDSSFYGRHSGACAASTRHTPADTPHSGGTRPPCRTAAAPPGTGQCWPPHAQSLHVRPSTGMGEWGTEARARRLGKPTCASDGHRAPECRLLYVRHCVKSPLDRHLHLKLGAQRQACTQVENIERDESRSTSTQNEETYPDIFGRVDFCPPEAHTSKNKDYGHQQIA